MVPVALHDLLMHPRFVHAVIAGGDVTAAVALAAHHNSHVASILGLCECMVAHWDVLINCLLPMHRAGMLAWLVQHVKTTQPPRPYLVQAMLNNHTDAQHHVSARQWQELGSKVRQHRLRLALRSARAVQAARAAACAAAMHAQEVTYHAQLAVACLQQQRRQQCQTAVAAACAAASGGAREAMTAAARAARAAEHAEARQTQARLSVTATARAAAHAAAQAAARAAVMAEQAVAQARKHRVGRNWQRWRLKVLTAQRLRHWMLDQQQKCRQEDQDRERLRDMLRAHQYERQQALLIWRWQRWALELRENEELERWTKAPYTHPLLLVRALAEQRRGNPPENYCCAQVGLPLDRRRPKLEWTEPVTAAALVLQLPPAIPTWLVDLRICRPSGNKTVRFACTFGWQYLQRFLSKYVRMNYVQHLASHPPGSPVPTYRVLGLWPPMELRVGCCNARHDGTVVARDGLYSYIHFDIGNKDNVHQSRIKNVNLEVGDRVQAPYQNWTPTGSAMYHQQLEDSIAPNVLQKFSQTPMIAQQLQAVRRPLSTKAPKKGKKKRR